MMRGHVLFDCCVGVFLPFPWVRRQAFEFMEYLDQAIGVDNLDTFSYILIGHAVIMFVLAEVDVTVLVNGSLA